uniref:ABC transporter substrate-binding protein n=1 Tax=Agathobacter sp. TaxID=2021311 RepID=UPI0040568129
MKRKWLCCICVAVILLLCACGSSDSTGGTLTICADGNGMNEMFLGPILAEFERQNPDVELVVEYLPPANSADSVMAEERTSALTRARTELMSGEGADIYLFYNMASPVDYETYMLFPNLERQIQGNVFHDLDFLFEHPDFDENDYVPALKQAGAYEGKSYVLPISYTATAFVGLTEQLLSSGFDEENAAVSTTAYMEEMLAMSDAQRPYLAMASRYYLLKAGSLSPVSVENAEIQLNMPQWQELLELNRYITENCGFSEEDSRKSLEEYQIHIENGAAVLPGLSSQAGYFLRVLEDSGHETRLLPIPNENGGITMMPHITVAVSAGCENTDAAASLLLFLLGETVQGSEKLEQSGGNASLFITGNSWPVRKGCGVKMLEHIEVYPVEYGTVSDVLKADVEKMENRIDTCRLASGYDGELPELIVPYLDGEQTWEECYANIEKEWSYLDE